MSRCLKTNLALIVCIYVLLFAVPAIASSWNEDMAKRVPAAAIQEGHWWVLGAFDWVKEPRMFWGDIPLPPDNSFDLTKTYKGRKGEAKWKEVPEWDVDSKMYEIAPKLADFAEPEGCVAAYIYRQIDSPADTDAILYFGFDDGCVLNINGEVVFSRFYYRGTELRQEAIPIHLKKGRNDFLLKIADKDNTSESSFAFDIRPSCSPEKYAKALEYLVKTYPNETVKVLDAKVRLVKLYRQIGELNKADTLAASIAVDANATKEQKNAMLEYSKSRPTGVGLITGYGPEGNRVAFKTIKGTFYVGFWEDNAPRITFIPTNTTWPYPANHRPVPVSFDRANLGKISAVTDEGNKFVVNGGKVKVEVFKDGSGVVFVSNNKRRFVELGQEDQIKRIEWYELKTFKGPYETAVFHLDTAEGVYGMGHRYDTFNRRGRFNSIGNCDRGFGESHFTLPYFVTQGHDALYVNSYGDGEFDVDRTNTENVALCRLQEDVIDFFYFVGEPKTIVKNYVDLTGHTVMPPDWTLGVWMSRNSYENQDVVLDVAKNLRKNKVPSDVLVLEAWREGNKDWMKWGTENWKDHEQMCKTLHEMGFKVVIWTMQFHMFNQKNPLPYEKEAFDNKYFCRTGDTPWGWDKNSEQNSYIVDFFNPDAVKWWENCYTPLFNPVTGIDGLKTDIGENNGGQTVQGWTHINNIYALGYLKTAWEMTKKITGEGMVFARTGTVGTQKYPILWAGDHMTWFQGQQDALNAMMSSGLAGYAWTSFDVGGLFGDLDKETYVRMAEMGAFCPIMQCHGMGKREPYDFGDYKEEATEVFNQYAHWYMDLKPYRIACGKEAVKNGVPMMRPLWMEYPNDTECYNTEYQYFFGPDIMCAPIMAYNHTRKLYLPQGSWIDWWTGEAVKGGRYLTVTMPLEKMPIYVRPGSSVLKFAPGVKK